MIKPLSEFGAFEAVWIFAIGGSLFAILGLIASKLIAPSRPNPEKNTTYECGEDPVGSAAIQLNNRFYVVALIFLIFEVEVLFLFPWASVYAEKSLVQEIPLWGVFVWVEMLVFVGILLLGLFWVWHKGDLDWIKPKQKVPQNITQIPEDKYDLVNQRYTAASKTQEALTIK